MLDIVAGRATHPTLSTAAHGKNRLIREGRAELQIRNRMRSRVASIEPHADNHHIDEI